mgnify:CR=1 FL=1
MSDDGETPRRFASKPKPELQKTDIFWQAFIAALLIALPLRLRRYGFRPALGLSTALLEGGLAVIAFLAVLLLSRWA